MTITPTNNHSGSIDFIAIKECLVAGTLEIIGMLFFNENKKMLVFVQWMNQQIKLSI